MSQYCLLLRKDLRQPLPPAHWPQGFTLVTLTEELLLRRIAKLDAALRRATASGDEPNPAAVALLQKYRLQATTRQGAAEREALWKTLDDFERTFLR